MLDTKATTRRSSQVAAQSLPVLIAAYCCVMCCHPFIVAIAAPCRPGMLWASALGTLGTLCLVLLSRQGRNVYVALVARAGASCGPQHVGRLRWRVLLTAALCCRLCSSITASRRPGMLRSSAALWYIVFGFALASGLQCVWLSLLELAQASGLSTVVASGGECC